MTVTVYRRYTPSGRVGYLVSNYAGGTRRLDSYATEESALEAAQKLVRQMSEGNVLAARLTNDDAASYTAALQKLAPTGVGLVSAAETVAECLRIVGGGLPTLLAAAEHFAATRARVTPRPVKAAVADYIASKESQGAAKRYVEDLRSRLGQLEDACRMDVGDVTTAALQAWLDQLHLAPQSLRNFRTVLVGFFKFAKAHGWCAVNVAEGILIPKVRGMAEPATFTVDEFRRLLEAADDDFVPVLVLGGFAGLRSAEIERVHWEDLNLATGELVIRRGTAKTRSRRVVPLCDAARAWLAPYASRRGPVWLGGHEGFHEAQQATARAAGLRWKANGLRHAYASHRLAVTGDAVRVAHEMGNSADVVHGHYKALIGAADGAAWFDIIPRRPANLAFMKKEAA